MRGRFHKGFIAILLSIFVFCGYSQKKDSAVAKPILKEEGLTNKKRKFLYFVSNRVSEDDKYDMFKFIPSDREPGIIIIKGHVEILDNPTKKKAKITVYNISNNEMVGIYNTNTYTGNYLMVLVPNVKYQFKVEAEGYEVMKEIVEVPLKFDYEVGKQEIKIRRNEQRKSVAGINNFFTDGNEKIFILRSSADSTRKEAENAGYVETDAHKAPETKTDKAYSTIDELVKKQLEEEKKKPVEALKAFKNKDHQTALPIYADLLKNNPGDPFLNYYYGICLLKSSRNRARAISCLEMAAHFKEVPRDVYLNLAKAYQLAYMFGDGLRALEEYKKYAKPTELTNPEIVQLFSNCKSGGALMNEQVNFEVLRRAPVQEDNLPVNYNPEFINDKLMYKTDFFSSAIDKKKPKLLMCKNGKNEIIHASYGIKEDNLDLYKNTLQPRGAFSAATSLGTEINTPYDENYPYISKDGKTLYFSSKGHNSMGGYDIFKCTRADSSAAWSKPENVGFPINSTYDDILFIPDPDGRYASFCTNRKSEKFEYIQIKTWQKANAFSIIKGNFSIDSSKNSDAVITVFNAQSDEIAGVYKTNSDNGNYLMVLSAGQSYYMLIETDGYPELNNSFDVPEKKGDFILKQSIRLGKDNIQNSFKVINYFTEEQAANAVFETKKSVKEVAKVVEKKVDHGPQLKFGKLKRTAEENALDLQNLKDAKNLFDQENYQEATVIYKQLEQYIDLDPINCYYYGVCLFYAKKDKVHAAHLLEVASASKTVPVDVFYYLGKANHMNYKFSTAITAYQKYIAVAKPADVKKLDVEKEIEYCNNGIQLVNNPVVIEVFDKKHIALESVHMALTHLESGAKILVSTEDILSSVDKRKKYKPVIFLSPDKNTIYYSSYGENEDKGKDIFCIKKMGNGKWSPIPFNLPVNSTYDEEYPALSPDGKTLFFSSKGHNTMGGYDIFKSEWNETSQSWGQPVNLGSPINSPYDDIYYVE